VLKLFKDKVDATESGYFAVRGLLAKSVVEAARFIAERGGVAEGAPVLTRLIAQIASRFGVVVTQKFAAQAVPVIGALGCGGKLRVYGSPPGADLFGGSFHAGVAGAEKMIEKVVRSHTRFNVNMARIAGLMKLALSGDGELKPTGFMTYEGVNADIFRLIVVFLHAAVEDLVRSQLSANRQFSFQSGADIDKALRHAGFDSNSLKPLYRPLTAMAKRRTRIVHEADLASNSSTIVEPWSVADLWQLTQWNLAVVAFYYQMLILLTEPRQVFVERYDNARKAMDANIRFTNQLMNFPKGSLKLQQKALGDMKESLGAMLSLLQPPKPGPTPIPAS
jgi:hypothetical protein